MEKRRIGPQRTMDGLPKASIAKVNFLSLPKPVMTMWDTGFGAMGEKMLGGGFKWEMDVEILEHPKQEPGTMAWQTTAECIRVHLMRLVEDSGDDLTALEKDLFRKDYWCIEADENGVINLVEL